MAVPRVLPQFLRFAGGNEERQLITSPLFPILLEGGLDVKLHLKGRIAHHYGQV